MPSRKKARVMVVDDHPLLRMGLQDVLEESGEFEVVGQAKDGVEAVSLAEESLPDVIVMDVLMPRKNGVEACQEILQLLPETKVLMLTASTEEDAVIQAVAAGATGYVKKFTQGEALVAAVRDVAMGKLLIPDDTVKRAFQLLRGGAVAPPGPSALTDREQETLKLFARGKSYAQVAQARGVSMVTVRNAIYRIQDKLGVKSKQEIVVWAVRNGLLDEEGPG